MRTTKHKRKPDVKAIARKYGRTTRTVRDWIKEAPPGTFANERKLDAWLANRRHQVFKVSAPPKKSAVKLPATTTPTPDEVAGAAANLRRLERAEVQCFNDLQAALAAADPLAIRNARKAWLETGSELRRSDLAVELARRDAGELLPIRKLQEAFGLLMYGVRLQLSHFGEHTANDAWITGMLAILSNEKDGWLHDRISADVSAWIGQYDNHRTRALALYAECVDAVRANEVPDTDEGRAIGAICQRAIAKLKDAPPILPKAEHEDQLFKEILERSHQTNERKNL